MFMFYMLEILMNIYYIIKKEKICFFTYETHVNGIQ